MSSNMVDDNVDLTEQKYGNGSIYITSQKGLCDEKELFINRSRCYATVPLTDNAIAGCVATDLGRVIAAL
jgi:CMP-N-acetylneuraminic acid synthetase